MQAHTATAARTRRHGPAPKPRRKPTSGGDAGNRLYGPALAYVHLQRHTTCAELAQQLDISPGSARILLERMVDEGVMQYPDMFGVYVRAAVAEAGEGDSHD